MCVIPNNLGDSLTRNTLATDGQNMALGETDAVVGFGNKKPEKVAVLGGSETEGVIGFGNKKPPEKAAVLGGSETESGGKPKGVSSLIQTARRRAAVSLLTPL